VALLAATSCGVAGGAREPIGAGIEADYEVRVLPSLDLDVDARFAKPADARALAVDPAAAGQIEGLSVEGTHVRYHVRLAEAATKLADQDVAFSCGGAIVAPPSTWLLHDAAPGIRRFHVVTPPGTGFATGVHSVANGTYQLTERDWDETSYAMLGPIKVAKTKDPKSFVVRAPDVPFEDARWASFAEKEQAAISAYFGAQPSSAIFVVLGTTDDNHGKTLGDGGPSVLFRLGKGADARVLEKDWVLAHELVHVSVPSLPQGANWFAEGMATYVEPIARARAGLTTPEEVWGDMFEQMSRGLPKAGDPTGLDGSDDIDRIYWGGALYFLLADLRLRERTDGKVGLEDALRGMRGANVETHWDLKRMIDACDRATGMHVFADLYAEMGRTPVITDLPALFRRMGIAGNPARFDATAPLAKVREAISGVTHNR
jgi:hypothetical protein